MQPEHAILSAAAEVADENGWSHDWLNGNATMFIPSSGADPEWETLYADETVTVEVASPRALLAMKLNASRPGRDVQDIANLLAICDIRDLDAAEDLLTDFYPGDGLPDKALRLLGPIFEQGIPAIPAPPDFPLFGQSTR